MTRSARTLALLLALALLLGKGASAFDLVRDGKAETEIWHSADGDEAARELADAIERMSGARLPLREARVGERPEAERAAVVVGTLAVELGLAPPPKTPSGDGYRISVKGKRALLAGETTESTYFAACHLLEALGCRWFFDNPLGEVLPERRTVSLEEMEIEEKPDFLSRRLWGPNWHAVQWKRRNRLGGLDLPTGHDWQYLAPERYGTEHPEYYALRARERRVGPWLCTSNPEVRKLFSEAVAEAVRGRGAVGISISPPDGTGYCECERCRAEDAPGQIEPSSGRVAVSDRYLRFFDSVARRALEANPQAILSFYAYADYSLPPKEFRSACPNLCAWIAPIRFCRFHALGSPVCESRRRCLEALEGWAAAVSKIGWREYNYNLAEATVPFSKLSVFRNDFPLLKRKGCIGVNIECLALWHIYGPHTYLAARLAWDADADVDAVLDDLYTRLFGKAAASVRAYWERIDRAYREADAHSGSFYSLHAIWTPDLLAACERDLAAAEASAEDELVRKRVGMFRAGLESARFYLSLRGAVNRCDFVEARAIYDRWMAHLDAIYEAGIHPVGEYRRGYAPRFLGPSVFEGHARVAGSGRMLLQLPDEWLFREDPDDLGESLGWHGREVSLEGWRRVKTYSATLCDQGVRESFAFLWYRSGFEAPNEIPATRIRLFFTEIDGLGGKVFLDGEHVGDLAPKRGPQEVEVTGRIRPGGRHVVAVKVDHRRITELFLGGIVAPAFLWAEK